MLATSLYHRLYSSTPKAAYRLCAWGIVLGGIAGAVTGVGISLASGFISSEDYRMILSIILFPAILGAVVGYITANLIASSMIGYAVSLPLGLHSKSRSQLKHKEKILQNAMSEVQKQDYDSSAFIYSAATSSTANRSFVNPYNFGIPPVKLDMHVQAMQQLEKNGLHLRHADFI